MGDAARCEGMLKRAGDRLLPDEGVEAAVSPFSGKGDVGRHRRIHSKHAKEPRPTMSSGTPAAPGGIS